MRKRSDQGQQTEVTPTVPPPALGKERRWRHWVCRSHSSKLQTLFHKGTIPTGFTVQKESTQRAYKLLSVPLAIKSHPQNLIQKLSSFSGNNTSFFSFDTIFFISSVFLDRWCFLMAYRHYLDALSVQGKSGKDYQHTLFPHTGAL